MTIALYIIPIIFFSCVVFSSSKQQLHMAQLEGYKPIKYWWWIKHNLALLYLREGFIFLVYIVFYVIERNKGYSDILGYASVITWVITNSYFIYRSFSKKREVKKQLVFTHRAIRLFILNIGFLLLLLYLSYTGSKNIVTYILMLAVIKFLLPFIMLLSIVVIYPVEKTIQYGYFRSAQIKIHEMKGLKVLGITGSYGKTSTKYFIKTILSEKYNTLMTPESYNTPMGISKIIREQLDEKHEVFVCEMGACNIGDIKTLCALVSPSIGILTSIGPQHLETFKSIGNVAKTKYELIEALPYEGTAIFNGDDSFCLEYARRTGIETLIYGIDSKAEDIYISAIEIKNSKEGLKFKVIGQSEINFECNTCLLGKHNISNILAAICAALKFGLTIEEIKRGISKIKPVPHRLEILNTNNGVTVIDDSFNSNPSGAREALEVIRDLNQGNRIVITPGMVELGKIENEENKRFGRIMADCCDYAILIGGKRSKPIVEGLRLGSFPEDRIIITANLKEATERLSKIVKSGDVVLFENDLPDNYNE